MIPVKGSSSVEIPLTFDGTGKSRANKSSRLLFTFLVFLGWLMVTIVALFATDTWVPKVVVPLVAGYLAFMILRFIVAKETYYRKKREGLARRDYMFQHDVFWNIFSIEEQFPYIVSFANGAIGVYVALDKDVIVGREEDANDLHYAAIAEAERQMVSRKIECMHIDYMDTVGKDKRMEGLFTAASGIDSDIMKHVITRIYDNLESNMNVAYASYDVYCFVYRGRPETFWSELQAVLACFKRANYIRYRVLDKTAIGVLAESVINIESFSVNNACDALYRELNRTHSLRVIWTSKDGEITKHNLTREEQYASAQVNDARKRVKVKRRLLFSKKRRQAENELLKEYNSDESSSLDRQVSSSVDIEELLNKQNEDHKKATGLSAPVEEEDNLY